MHAIHENPQSGSAQWRFTPTLACMKMILEILVVFLSKNIYSYEAFESRTLNENVLVGNFQA